MKRIIWFSNCILSNSNPKASGSWLYSMARLLTRDNDIKLINITNGCDKSHNDIRHIGISSEFEEYLLPDWTIGKNNMPKAKDCQTILELCRAINPDIIHIWGVENYYSTLVPTFALQTPLLLEIQGLQKPCSEVYYGDLTPSEIFKCFGLREFLFPFHKSICSFRRDMARKGIIECDTIKKYKYISTQSKWIREQIKLINSKAQIYETGMSLREEFWNATKWEYNAEKKDFYCSAAGSAPYKCIQTAIKALKTVAQFYPETKLYVIGNFIDQNWMHQPGYLTFIKRMVKDLKLENNVIFTGPLNATEIIDIMYKCLGMVQTSYVESYSLAVAEAQAVGIPSIISYAGAMPELATDHESGLFFSPGDHISCANKMIELIENPALAINISEKSYTIANERNNNETVLTKQIEIYNKIIDYEE